MTAIAHILRWGTGEWATVLLECGHSRRLRRADVRREQLYVGKVVPCAGCGEEPRPALRMERRKNA